MRHQSVKIMKVNKILSPAGQRDRQKRSFCMQTIDNSEDATRQQVSSHTVQMEGCKPGYNPVRVQIELFRTQVPTGQSAAPCSPSRAPRNAIDLKFREDRYLIRIQKAHHEGTVVPLRTSRSCSNCVRYKSNHGAPLAPQRTCVH